MRVLVISVLLLPVSVSLLLVSVSVSLLLESVSVSVLLVSVSVCRIVSMVCLAPMPRMVLSMAFKMVGMVWVLRLWAPGVWRDRGGWWVGGAGEEG